MFQLPTLDTECGESLDKFSVSNFEKRVGCLGRVEQKWGTNISPILDLKSGGWWMAVALGSKRTHIWPKSRGADLRQKWELGQTKSMYGGLLGQTNLLGALF